MLDGPAAADLGDEVFLGNRKVGVVTFGMYSALTKTSMAIARLDVPAAVYGTRLEVRGKHDPLPGIAHSLQFDDPDKKKRTAEC